MQEKFRQELLTILSDDFSSEQLKIIDKSLTLTLTNYDVTQKCTDIVVYQDDLPYEIKSFLVCKKIKGLAKTTLIHYQRVLKHFASNINKDIKLLTSNDIRFYLLSYEKTHNTGKSALDDKRRVLNSFYKWMVAEDIIIKSPMDRIDPIKCDKKLKEPLSVLELEQIRGICKTIRETAILEALYSTGCRVTELISLNKTDINYETGRIKVLGKGKKERYVFLNAKAQIAIKKYIFSRTDDNEALFVAGKKPFNRLGKGTIEKEMKNLGIRANINRDVFPHLIRATMASHSLNRGMSLAEVQLILGHSDPKTTEIYAKMNCDELQHIFKKCII